MALHQTLTIKYGLPSKFFSLEEGGCNASVIVPVNGSSVACCILPVATRKPCR